MANDELERIWKEAVVTFFKMPPPKITPDRDSKPRPPDYNAGVLTIELRRSVYSTFYGEYEKRASGSRRQI
jgi:hypothetical protein